MEDMTFEQAIAKLNAIAKDLSESSHPDDVKLSCLRGAMLNMLGINPENIVSDQERIARNEMMDIMSNFV